MALGALRFLGPQGDRLAFADRAGFHAGRSHSRGGQIGAGVPVRQERKDASGSTDAEGQPLTYVWDFGDGETQTTTDPEAFVSHTYTRRGEYEVSVTVKDNTTGVSDPPARMTVYPANTPPDRPMVTSPADESTFTVPPRGEVAAQAAGDIAATGSPTDLEGDTVTLKWEVVRHRDANHVHPYANGIGGTFSFPGAEPEGLYSADPRKNYVELRFTAEDEFGLASETASIDIRPRGR